MAIRPKQIWSITCRLNHRVINGGWKTVGKFFLKGLLVIFILGFTYRLSQNFLYFYLESNVPEGVPFSIQKEGKWFGFETKGNFSEEQINSLKKALLLLPRDILLSFSDGKTHFKGSEPRLVFYILGEEDFKELAPWYHKKQAIEHLDAFYSNGKIFIRNHLESEKFLENVTHELIHAFSDYLVQGPWYSSQLIERGNLLDFIGRGLEGHKREQALKIFARLKNSNQMGKYARLYDEIFKSQLLLNNHGILSHEDQKAIVRSLSCCFVSLYSFIGDFNQQMKMPVEYWAENYTSFLLEPNKLKMKDPILYEAIQSFDQHYRISGNLEASIMSFLKILERETI